VLSHLLLLIRVCLLLDHTKALLLPQNEKNTKVEMLLLTLIFVGFELSGKVRSKTCNLPTEGKTDIRRDTSHSRIYGKPIHKHFRFELCR
jgi:hypothetical protein